MPRIAPTPAALEIAYRSLRSTMSLDDMLKSRPLTLILENIARRHMQRLARLDLKKLQANDTDGTEQKNG